MDSYTILVRGKLDRTWAFWFDGMTLERDPGDANLTRIRGVVRDQTELHSVLVKIRDLNLVLIALERSSEQGESNI